MKSSNIPKEKLVSVFDLCKSAGIACKVSGLDAHKESILIDSADGLPTGKIMNGIGRDIYVINQSDILDDHPDLRALEILAYAFFHYSARECVRGLFGVNKIDAQRVIDDNVIIGVMSQS